MANSASPSLSTDSTPFVSPSAGAPLTARAPVQPTAMLNRVRYGSVRWAMSLALLAGDVLGLLLVGAIGGAVGLLSGGAASLWASGFAVPVGGGGTLALLAAYAVTGLYSHPLVHPAEEMHRLATVTAGMGGVAGAALFIGGGPLTVSVLVAGVGGVGACVIPLTRGLVRVLCAQTTWWGIPTLVLGSDRLGASVVDTLSRWPEIGLRPVARLTDGASLADRPGTASVPIVGRIQEAPVLARRYRIPHAVFALPALSHAERAKRIATYSKFFDHVLVLADMGDWPALWASGGMGKGLVGYNVRHYALQPAARLVKRTLDLVGALCALVLLAPVFAVIAALIKADDPGPVLYRQHRMGRDGRVFTVLKFRTMYTDAHRKLQAILDSDPRRRREYERYHKLKDDPRVTTIGRVLRASSLDELPQLLNVLKGEMSLVGPRAYMPGELPKMNGLSRAVLQTPPGITGLWQVSGRNRLSFDARVDLDVHYIQNWSPWLDLYILVRTIPVVLTGDGAC